MKLKGAAGVVAVAALGLLGAAVTCRAQADLCTKHNIHVPPPVRD